MLPLNRQRHVKMALSAWLVVAGAGSFLGYAQSPPPADHAQHVHPATSAPTDKSLTDQVADLRAQVAALQTALQQSHKQRMSGAQMGSGSGGAMGASGSMTGMGRGSGASMGPMAGAGKQGMAGMGGGAAQGGGMGMMDMDDMMGGSMPSMGGGKGSMSAGGGGMGMMDMDNMPMGGMGGGSQAGGGMGGMGQQMMGMMGMMGMGPGAKMSMTSALPGFPGASHLYHVGSTGFFLDHDEHITLSLEQRTALNAIKEKATLTQASSQRDIDDAEQELWTLTGSDQPDAQKIEAKVREIEKQRGDQRMNFIRSVGEAAKALTDEQRKSLLGQQPPQTQGSSGSMGHM
jgi:Spy/CpxP family protein refolding chaperone